MINGKGIYKIDGYSLVGILAALILTTIILILPLPIRLAGNGSWITPIIAGISGAYIIYIVYRLSILYPGLAFFEYLPLIVGKAAGKIIGISYILLLFYITISVDKQTVLTFYGTGTITYTPEIVIAILFIIGTTYGVAKGIEVIARTFIIFWVVIVAAYLFILFLSMSIWNMKYFLPLGEISASAIMQGSIPLISYQSELFFLAMLIPYCRSPREAYIAGNIANLLITFEILLTIVAGVAVMGPESVARVLFLPFYLADFIKPIGLKVILVAIWSISFWCKASVLQFILTDGITKITGLKEHRPIILPIGVLLLFNWMTLNKNSSDFYTSIVDTFPGAMLFFGFLIPTFLLILAQIKAKVNSKSHLKKYA